MSNLENNNSSIYPYNYDELTNQHDLEESRQAEELRRIQISGDLGIVAMAAITGIAGPEYKEATQVRPSIKQVEKLGATSVSSMITMDRPSFMDSLSIEQAATLNEKAVLGYAEQYEYRLAA